MSSSQTINDPSETVSIIEPQPQFRWVRIKSLTELTEFYLSCLPAIRSVARDCGYAIGVHGSLERDFDLIAVPWIDHYSEIDHLARMIHNAACGLSQDLYTWEHKPVGRMATSFPICWLENQHYDRLGVGHIDLSVIGHGTNHESRS